MAKKDPRIDAYISESAAFAKPILKHLRKIVHAGCPAVEETIKWQFPHFDYKGVLCGMAAFQQHCAFGFWKGSLILGEKNSGDSGMGQFGRIESIDDLPDEKTLLGYVRKAAELNEKGIKAPGRTAPKKKPPFQVPDYLTAALTKNAKAKKTFANFPPSQQREYVEWLTEAKREETRARRLATAIEWMAEGKKRNWKHLP
ncbi:MAG: YdeI/OmpD-associated family protein [Spartobacteria bacterium]